ncbi:MAG: hypothetical protein IKI63_01620, partial [Clostridia bacterium]|nr:hypothetical protein [Clostridia bacterium]
DPSEKEMQEVFDRVFEREKARILGENESFSHLTENLEIVSETEEKIRARLERAVWELTQVDAYRYLIVNDEVEKAADRLIDIIELETEIKQETNQL